MIAGVWLPLVTPFRNATVDTDALQRLVARYLTSGISGFVALGTTAEAALLTPGERRSVLHAVHEAAAGRLPVMVGVGGMATHDMQREIRALARWEPAGYLVPAPAYIRPDQDGLRWHFERIADSTDRPIVVYDVPHRTGCAIAPETLERLLARPNIAAIKACVPETFAAFSRLPVDLLCGTDDAFLSCLENGGSGGILASAHVFPTELCEIRRLFGTHDKAGAAARFDALLPVLRLLFSAPNPAAIKAALALAGLTDAATRPPIMPARAALVHDLEQALSRFTRFARPARPRARAATATEGLH